MRKIVLLFMMLLSANFYGQIIELQKLSNGKLIQGQPLYNKDQNDIYGYLFVFEKDQMDKKEFLYEYALFDKNLNKVLGGEFIEKLGNYGKMILVEGIYRDGYISFKIDEKFAEYGAKLRTRYRVLDIHQNKLSDAFYLNSELQKIYNEVTETIKESTVFTFLPNSFGYDLMSPLENNGDSGMYSFSYKEGVNESKKNKISFFDEKLDLKWSYSFNKQATRKQYEEIKFLNSKNNTDYLIGRKLYNGKNNLKLREKGALFNSFLFFNKESGKLLSEFSPYGKVSHNASEYIDISTVNVFVDASGTVTFLDRLMSSKVKKFELNEERIVGFSKTNFDLNKGSELSKSFFTWKQLEEYLPINEFGYINEKGAPNTYLYLHDVILKSNGGLLFITEQYKTLGGSFDGTQGVKIGDLIFFELDSNMELDNFKRISKESRNYRNGIKMKGVEADRFGFFDYSGYQNLDDDQFLFFYFNKQRPEGGGRKQWVLGMISYSDGSYHEQILPLKSSDGSDLSIAPAKKGYILIMERFKDKSKGVELRLERIN